MKTFRPSTIYCFAIISAILIACEKDNYRPDRYHSISEPRDISSNYISRRRVPDTYEEVRNATERLGGIVQLTVIMSDITSPLSNNNDFSGSIKINQHGKIYHQVFHNTDTIVFQDLRIGMVTIEFVCNGYLTFHAIYSIHPPYYDGSEDFYDEMWLDEEYYGVRTSASFVCPVVPVDPENQFHVTGHLTYEKDLTNDTPELAEKVGVILHIDTGDTLFDTYKGIKETCSENNDYPLSSELQVFLYELSDTITGKYAYLETITDEEGNFSFQLPVDLNRLPVKIEIPVIRTKQVLLINKPYDEDMYGLDTVHVRFSSDIIDSDQSDDPKCKASDIPVLPPVHVDISNPEHMGSNCNPQIFGEINVTVSNNQGEDSCRIEKIFVTNPGIGYDACNSLDIEIIPAPEDSIIEEAELVYTLIDGRIAGIEIKNPGKGYCTPPEIKMHKGEVYPAVGIPVVKNGRIKGVSFHDTSGYYKNLTNGQGYGLNPEITFVPVIPGHGSGARGKAVVDPKSRIVYIIMIDSGSGYTAKNMYAEIYDGTNAGNNPGNNTGKGTSAKLYRNGGYTGSLHPENGELRFSVQKKEEIHLNINLGTGIRFID